MPTATVYITLHRFIIMVFYHLRILCLSKTELLPITIVYICSITFSTETALTEEVLVYLKSLTCSVISLMK